MLLRLSIDVLRRKSPYYRLLSPTPIWHLMHAVWLCNSTATTTTTPPKLFLWHDTLARVLISFKADHSSFNYSMNILIMALSIFCLKMLAPFVRQCSHSCSHLRARRKFFYSFSSLLIEQPCLKSLAIHLIPFNVPQFLARRSWLTTLQKD